MIEKTYLVNGMSCIICKNNIETGLKKIEGISNCVVNLLENEVTITFDETLIDETLLSKIIKDIGYELVIKRNDDKDIDKIKMIISITLMIILMFVSMSEMINIKLPAYSVYIQLLLALIIIIINKKYYISGFRSLIKLSPNMDSLVSISSFVSFIYSIVVLIRNEGHLYFETSAMILVIVSIGKYIEGKNKKKATSTIRGLSSLIPMQANLLVDDKIKVIPIDELKKNDVVRVMPGDSIPQDGIIINGISDIDESLITGESLQVSKTVDDKVIGGTVNLNGTIDVLITTKNTNTTLSRIISLTKQASLSKIKAQRIVDIICKYFVFSIIFISLITFVIWYLMEKDINLALNFALSVLVISCPCALGLATPSAISVASNLAAKNKIFIKNPEVLETAGKLKYIIFDKTGTLTLNKLEIIELRQYDDEFINVLSSLEKLSSHPIANTINEKYKEGNIEFDNFKVVLSKGIIGNKDKDTYYAGNINLINDYIDDYHSMDIDYAKNNNYSYILVGKNNKILGIIYLADILKKDAKKTISNLINKNITPIMASGDNEISCRKIANELNIKEYYSSIHPDEKNTLIAKYQEKGKTAMVGDGINDAIALSVSDVSFSFIKASDIANATSDIVLMNDDLDDINLFINISRKTFRIIKENLLWALLYNSLCIPIAAGLFYKSFNLMLNPMFGSITMCISSIMILSNSLRINTIRKEK